MKSKKLLTLLIAPMFAIGMTACDVDQTEEGEMPDVEVQEGELPAYDVETPEVDVEQDTVTVPDVDLEEPGNDQQMNQGTEGDGTMRNQGTTEGSGEYR